MKRTYQQSLTFFKHKTCYRGDGREFYKTPSGLIYAIVDNLLTNFPYLKNYDWVDPCAGDGIWERVIAKFGIKCQSYDIHPLSSSIIKQDFLNTNDKNKFYIGNPPFSFVKRFVEHALKNDNICYFLGGSQLITGSLSNKVKFLHRFEGFEGNQKDKRSKAIFKDTFGENILIWCCGGLFENKNYHKFLRKNEQAENYFRTSIKCWCEINERVKEIRFERSTYE